MNRRESRSVRRRPSLVARFLQTPLFHKLLLWNLVVIGAATVGVLVFSGQAGSGASPLEISALVGLALALAAVASAGVLRLALAPLRQLTSTAGRIRAGDYSVRVPVSPFADEATREVIELFNRVLDAFESAQEEHRSSARQVLQSEERERARIAHELYARTAQTMAGVLVRLQVAARRVQDEQQQRILSELLDHVRGALEEIRESAWRLSPPEIDELGIVAALKAHIRRCEAESVEVAIVGTVPDEKIASDARLGLFRIVQEAVTNAIDHAAASRVEVRFATTSAGVEAVISDDGRGFDPDRSLLHGSGGLGLLGMRERADYASGELSIESAPGRGTRVRVFIPWTGAVTTLPEAPSALEQPLDSTQGAVPSTKR